MDPREEKLPRWARDELRNLRMRVEEARFDADAQLGSGVPSNVWLSKTGTAGQDMVPSRWPKARFLIGSRPQDWVEVYQGDQGLRVYGCDTLIVRPESTNLLTVSLAVPFAAEPPASMKPYIDRRRRP